MFTKHALKRCQQRAIPLNLCDLVLEFGEYRYDKHGARIWFVTKRSIEKIGHEFGIDEVKRLEKKKNIFLVEALDTNAVITVGHSFRASKSVSRH
ncbi:hypothetical protein MCEMIE11_00787 [Burkholderiales bacterium]